MKEKKINIKQTPQQINEAWELLYEHLQGCYSWGDKNVTKEDFIELGKKEFIIIPIIEKK